MAGKTAILAIKIISDATKASKGFQQAETASDKFSRRLGVANKAALLVAGGAVLLGKKLEAAGEAAGTSNARIEQVFKSMGTLGDKQEKVTNRVIKSAEKLARATGIDPNAIKQAQATLATFAEVSKTADKVGGSFDRATKLSADLAAGGFGSVESASVMLGKALNDPITGVSALRRVGVNLTTQQTEQVKAFVKSGDAAKAQNVILSAVEKQVGGVAEATANGSDKMKVASQLAQESIGQKLAPAFDKARNAGIGLADFMLKHQQTVITVGAVVLGLAAIIITVNAAYRAYQATLAAIAIIQKGSVILTAAQSAAQTALAAVIIVGTAAQIGFSVATRAVTAAMAANPVGAIIVALILVGSLFVLAYKKSDTFRAIVQAAGRAAGAAMGWVVGKVKDVVNWFKKLGPAVNVAKDIAVKAFRLYTAPIRTIISLISRLVGWIKKIKFPSVPKAISKLGGIFGGGDQPPAPHAPGGSAPPGGRGGPSGGGFMIPVGGGGNGSIINITVNGALDPDAVARQIEQLLRRRQTRVGVA